MQNYAFRVPQKNCDSARLDVADRFNFLGHLRIFQLFLDNLFSL